MDRDRVSSAQAQAGLLSSQELGSHASRTARRAGLVPVQPRVWIAATQPVGAREQVAAVRASVSGPHAFVGLTALWLYGLAPAPAEVQVAVPHRTRYRASAPTVVTRLSRSVLAGVRRQDGFRVVALEIALIQAATELPRVDLLRLVEDVLRRRLTTLARLRARCRRGVKGSAVVRRVLDELVGTSLDGAVRVLVAALAARGVTGLRTEVRFVSDAGASAYADVLDETGLTVLEVDGFLSHLQRERFRADRRRDRWMHAQHGILTLRVDVAEVSEDLERLADELAAVILARRASLRSVG